MSKKQHRRSGLPRAATDKAGDIRQATVSYDNWMRSCTTVILSDLRLKHEQMKESPFLFLRGTFYRWAQLWPALCAELFGAPKVLSVGDLHVNSFGTWRDARSEEHTAELQSLRHLVCRLLLEKKMRWTLAATVGVAQSGPALSSVAGLPA